MMIMTKGGMMTAATMEEEETTIGIRGNHKDGGRHD
jgi:hypothetical protein